MNEEIVARFGANTTEIDRAMRGLQSSAKEWAGGIGKVFAGAFAFTGAITAIKTFVSYVDRIGDQSDNLKVSTDFLQGFYREVGIAGGNSEKASAALNKFFVNIGNNDAAFKRFGINLKDENGTLKTNEQILGDVADALEKSENGAQRAAIGAAFFGKQWADVALALRGGKKAIEEMGESSIFKVDPQTIEQINMLKDSITGKGYGVTGLLSQIISIPMRLASGLAAGFGSMFGGQTFQQGLDNLAKGINTVNNTGGLKIISDQELAAIAKMDELLTKSLAGFFKAKFDAATPEQKIKLLKEELGVNERTLKALTERDVLVKDSANRERLIIDARTKILNLNREILEIETKISKEKADQDKKADKAIEDLNKLKQKQLDAFRPDLDKLAETPGPMRQQAQRAQDLKRQLEAAMISGNTKEQDRLAGELFGTEGPTKKQAEELERIKVANRVRKMQGLPLIPEPSEFGTKGLIPELEGNGMKEESAAQEIINLRRALEDSGIKIKEIVNG